MTIDRIKPPMWFWIVGVVALLWNLMGVGAYLAEAYMPDEAFALLSESEQKLYNSRPAWVTGAFATAVFAGAIGCIGLLIRKKWAKMVLLISLLSVIAQQIYMFFMSNTIEVMGSEALYFPIVVIIIAIALVFFARYAHKNSWLS